MLPLKKKIIFTNYIYQETSLIHRSSLFFYPMLRNTNFIYISNFIIETQFSVTAVRKPSSRFYCHDTSHLRQSTLYNSAALLTELVSTAVSTLIGCHGPIQSRGRPRQE